jgi:hypothetical protein
LSASWPSSIRAISMVGTNPPQAGDGPAVGRPSLHRIPNRTVVGQRRWPLRGGRLVPSTNVVLPRCYGRAPSFGRTRAAQLVRVSVAGTWPAFHGGWPVRRGVVAVGSGRVPPAWGWQGREVVSVA